MFQTILIYGCINSVILALIALGFNLTFGISGIANFAYGSLYILAGFGVWILLNLLKIPYLVSIVLSILFTAFLGALIYQFVLLRLRGLRDSEVIASFALGLIILEIFHIARFTGYKYALSEFSSGSVLIFDTLIDVHRLLILGIAIALGILLWIFIHHTKIGLAFRGIAQEEKTALILGINSDKMAALSMAFGAGLAAIAAILILPLGVISADSGYDILLNAVAVCIVGGMGSLAGAIVASFIIGYSQTLTSTYLGSHWTMIVALLAIILILVIKPSGLFGKQKAIEEKV